jgi:queuine tRNA-ribosyltransferase
MTTRFSFETRPEPRLNRARLGRLVTPHGAVDTPNFILCATKGALKGLTTEAAAAANTQFILSNTYHLMLQPGAEVVAAQGGLHKFAGWNGAFLTDSGGFQVFSLAHGGVADEIKGARRPTSTKSVLKITEAGVEFRSYIDGQKILLTPERSILVQRHLGADIILAFDECTPFHVDRAYTEASLQRTHRWTDRALTAFAEATDAYGPKSGSAGLQAFYGISQGGIYEDLRRTASDFLNDRDCFGFAVGGSLGNSKSQMYEVVDCATAGLRPEKPVHLLGIGGIHDIFTCVQFGIDTFDCVSPTRIGRHGWALVPAEIAGDSGGRAEPRLNLRNAAYRQDSAPVDPTCTCHTCTTYSRAYLHHLLKARELLAQTLLTLHNVATMSRVMADIRAGIAAGSLNAPRAFWLGA